MKTKVGILGGSGYGGGELLRLLLSHPEVSIELVTGHSSAGKAVSAVHPNLRGFTDLVFEETKVTDKWADLDILFVALPHGESMQILPELPKGCKIIDLGGDFRLRDQAVFERAYKRAHTSFEFQPSFVYGLSEMNKAKIAKATHIANPGCFATATLMGLCPLIAQEAIEGKIIVDAKTGSSGSGNKPSAGTHHPKRVNSFYAYKSFAHQHVPEIEQMLGDVCDGWDQRLVFQTHSAPMVRGIFASIYCTLRKSLDSAGVRALYENTYGDAPFVRLVEGSPDVNWVQTTQFTDIGWAVSGQDLSVFVAIDNLVKGAAGQAIHNMNLMLGFPEGTGLLLPGTHP